MLFVLFAVGELLAVSGVLWLVCSGLLVFSSVVGLLVLIVARSVLV